MSNFDEELANFIKDIGEEILATASGPARNDLTDLQILAMRLQDIRAGRPHIVFTDLGGKILSNSEESV